MEQRSTPLSFTTGGSFKKPCLTFRPFEVGSYLRLLQVLKLVGLTMSPPSKSVADDTAQHPTVPPRRPVSGPNGVLARHNAQALDSSGSSGSFGLSNSNDQMVATTAFSQYLYRPCYSAVQFLQMAHP